MQNEGAWRSSPGYSPGGIPGEIPGVTPGEIPGVTWQEPAVPPSQFRMPDNLARMIALVDTVFAMRDHPIQSLCALAFTEEGKHLARSVLRALGLPLLERKKR